ncbi:unnamed protein product [Symbiodinium natans]|uniref:Uncharacterized protein n=1 Tax=Symbiodinium natans TaxID=878477 RepID=A0A812PJK0_9DINO|nr:unnamed protein product [Symbiodinium natans]
MARSSSLLAFLVLALGCSAMLCFVGTTPPASKSLRAPAVQMEARGGADGALGDMTPDTYIIGITVFGIASLFANISGRSCSCACAGFPPRLAMARSSSLLAFLVLALGCSAMLCFVGTTPPASKSLRAPAVQMEARGGADGALGDMTPDTYIIGITVFGIASLFANISGFFNP